MISIDRERPFDTAAIENLLDTVFGPERAEKSSQSLRNNNQPIASLSYVARAGEKLVGTVRFWPIHVTDLLGGVKLDALLLGPLAVSPSVQNKGVGADLLTKAISAANGAGHQRILLVGELDYYARFGFKRVLPHYITLPGGRDARRLLVRQPATLQSLPSVGKLTVPSLAAPALTVPAPVSAPVHILPEVA